MELIVNDHCWKWGTNTMIKAELSHNPYLLDTKVLFHGKAPRINSLVEKYQDGELQTWIKLIPSIFYDEMNGYDFDLEFSGTKLDFSELQKSFAEAGVSDSMVHLFHKNELDGREEKLLLIDQLLKWLEGHPNEKFDYTTFREDYKELFEGTYPFIVFQKKPLDISIFDGSDIEVEQISEYQEVATTDLHNTPILFYISDENRKQFQNDLRKLIERPDVINAQLFFIADSSVDADKAARIVLDLGIPNPQFITSLADPIIENYMYLYPRSEYIYQAIKAFRKKTDVIGTELKEENHISEVQNRSVYAQIDELTDIITRLKDSLTKFRNRDNIDLPENWIAIQQELLAAIKNWRIRKTKITGTAEGEFQAVEFDKDLRYMYHNYLSSLNAAVINTKDDLYRSYSIIYEEAKYDESFSGSVKEVSIKVPDVDTIPSVVTNLLQEKEEQWVQPKEDLFGMFFKTTPSEPKEPVLETTYYYQAWRDLAANIIMPVAETVFQAYYECLKDYDATIAEMYMKHLDELLAEKIAKKEDVASNLSEDEQKLQANNDWLAGFTDQLDVIERG